MIIGNQKRQLLLLWSSSLSVGLWHSEKIQRWKNWWGICVTLQLIDKMRWVLVTYPPICISMTLIWPANDMAYVYLYNSYMCVYIERDIDIDILIFRMYSTCCPYFVSISIFCIPYCIPYPIAPTPKIVSHDGDQQLWFSF